MNNEYLKMKLNYCTIILQVVDLLISICTYHRTSTAKLYLDRSVADHSVINKVSNIKLQDLGSAYYTAGAPARGAPLAWGRCCAEILYS